MKNLLNNISQEEKERILEMHKKNITIISEQQEKSPAGININGKNYLNPNITSEAKLNAFLDIGNLTKENFKSLSDQFQSLGNKTEDRERIDAYGQKAFAADRIQKFMKIFLDFVAQQKRNPISGDSVMRYFEGPLKQTFETFRAVEWKPMNSSKETIYLLPNDKISVFANEFFDLVKKQTEKAKRA